MSKEDALAKATADVIPPMIQTRRRYEAELRNSLHPLSRTVFDYRSFFCLYSLFRPMLRDMRKSLFQEPYEILATIVGLVRGWLSPEPLVHQVNFAFKFQFGHVLKTFFTILGFMCRETSSEVDQAVEEYQLLALCHQVVRRCDCCKITETMSEDSWELIMNRLQEKYSNK